MASTITCLRGAAHHPVGVNLHLPGGPTRPSVRVRRVGLPSPVAHWRRCKTGRPRWRSQWWPGGVGFARCFRSGFTISSEVPPPDLRWLDFVYQLGEIAAAGGDIRDRLFGAGSAATGPS